ncbi:hypothetical protein TZ53_04985 [Sphingobium sp. YBL2]|nr:hypothetical protein TZ53_04985 [Sphingobium sp. YBL2]
MKLLFLYVLCRDMRAFPGRASLGMRERLMANGGILHPEHGTRQPFDAPAWLRLSHHCWMMRLRHVSQLL